MRRFPKIRAAIMAQKFELAQALLRDISPVGLGLSRLPELLKLYRLAGAAGQGVDAVGDFLGEFDADCPTRTSDQWVRTLLDSEQWERAESYLRGWIRQVPQQPIATHLLDALTAMTMPQRVPNTFTSAVADLYAEDYEATQAMSRYMAPTSMEGVLKGLSTTKREIALDAGCGTGLLGHALNSLYNRVTGLDLSPRALDFARRSGNYRELECCDLLDFLPADFSRFDLIAAADSFQSFGDLKELIADCLSALTPEGWLVFTLRAGPLTEHGYFLQPTGEFIHTPPYVIECLGENGIPGGSIKRLALRSIGGHPFYGLLIAVQRPH